MEGLMQKTPLIVNNILDYAAKFHGEQVVATWDAEFPRQTQHVTYRELHTRSKLCALALKGLGVRSGDVVATLAWNSSRHFECWYGIMGIGAVCHTLNVRLHQNDLEYIINHAGDTAIMADAMFAPLLEALLPHCPSVRHVILLSSERGMPKNASLRSPLCYEELLMDQYESLAGSQWEVPSEDCAAGLCYTSGTTSKPKGVLYSHRSNFLHALIGLQRDMVGLTSSSSVLVVVPLFHANSWALVFQGPMVGARLVLPGPELDGSNVYRLLESERVTVTAAVPTVLLGLLDHLERNRLRPSTLKLVVVGGAACPPAMMDTYEDKYGIEVMHMWGMTELSPVGTVGRLKGTLPSSLTVAQQRAIKLKQGRSHIFCDMRIVDDSGRELPHDGKAIGNVQVRGPQVIRQYFKADSPAVDKHGWFDTGDVGTMDEYGHMQITDRSKDVIKSGGEWISSIEIENLAVGHPQITEAAVIGIPDPKWSERPLLIVVPVFPQKASSQSPSAPSNSEPITQDSSAAISVESGLTRQTVLGYLEGKLAKWWMPEDVVFVREIPHTATSKISKLELRKRLKDWNVQKAKL